MVFVLSFYIFKIKALMITIDQVKVPGDWHPLFDSPIERCQSCPRFATVSEVQTRGLGIRVDCYSPVASNLSIVVQDSETGDLGLDSVALNRDLNDKSRLRVCQTTERVP